MQMSPLLMIALGTALVEHIYADIALDYANKLRGKKITVEGLDHAAVKSVETYGSGVVEFQVWGDTDTNYKMHTVLIAVSIAGTTVADASISHQIKCLRSRNGNAVNDFSTFASDQPTGLCGNVLTALKAAMKSASLDTARNYGETSDDAMILTLYRAIRPTETAPPTFKDLKIGKDTWHVVGAAPLMDKRLTGNVRALMFIAKATLNGKIASMQIVVIAAGNSYQVKLAQYALNGVAAAQANTVVADTSITDNDIMTGKIQAALKNAAK